MRKQINATLAVYCDFLETMPDAAFLADEHGGLVWANGVANLRKFKEKLSTEIERCVRHSRIFTLAHFDLDNFKVVNDSQGHEEGNKVLKQVVEVARNRLRKTDVIARIGGGDLSHAAGQCRVCDQSGGPVNVSSESQR